MKMTKNRKKINDSLDRMKEYSLEDAVKMVKKLKFTKFDESVDLAMNLGVDPRHADQNIRVSTSLPHGTGKDIKVLVVTQGPKEKEAEEAGADYVGKSYLEKIKGGWDDVDKIGKGIRSKRINAKSKKRNGNYGCYSSSKRIKSRKNRTKSREDRNYPCAVWKKLI